VGRFLRHSEEYLFKAIDKTFGGRTIFKGISSDQAGKDFHSMWNSFSDPVGIGMDASRFDQHVSREALEFEHRMWLGMFNHSDRKILKRLLSWQINNRGLARCPDGEIRYRVEGCRMSGDMNTSSGNCYIMCASVYTWCTQKRISKFRLANNGDDCMVVIERKDESKFRAGLIEYYRGLGFTMKVEPTVDVLERVEFCQTRPVLVGSSYRMVRNLHQSLSKDLHSLNDIASSESRDLWLDAVGKGGRVMNDGVPVLKAFFKQFPTTTSVMTSNSDLKQQLSEAYKYKFHREAKFEDLVPTHESRYSFWLAFGLTPDEQMALEAQFSPLKVGLIVQDIEEVTTLLQWSGA